MSEQQKDAINKQPPQTSATGQKRQPLRVFIGIEASGAVTLRAPAEELRKLATMIDVAIRRRSEGDGSISSPRQAGKGTAPLTVIAD